GAQALIGEKSLATLLNSLREGDIIGQVIASIRGTDTARALASRIFDALQGPEHAKDETASSNSARNLFFELRILGRCLAAGLEAKSCLHPDVRIEVDANVVHVECKRVFAASKLEQ